MRNWTNLNDLPPHLREANAHLFPAQAAAIAGGHGMTDEAELHCKIYDECMARGWIALHGSMAARTHRTLGEPDFVILADAGRVLFVECKTARGKLSEHQQAMIRHAFKFGHDIHIVRSLADFLEIIK